MSQPLVSIIVPVYNGAQYIQETVDSILSQTYTHFELYLINDGSTDNSVEVIEAIAKHDARVILVNKENGGVACARNTGVDMAKGEFIAFCDQDDLWLPEKLEKQIPLFANPNVGLVYCGAISDYKLYNKTNKPSFAQKKRGKVFDTLIQENMLTCCTAVIRRDCLKTIGGFDPDRALMGVDDWHLWLKIALVAEFDFVEEHLAIHVFHGDNYSLNDEKMHEAELVCLEKIEAIANQFGQSARWVLIKQQLHIRYAKSYIFSGLFNLAGDTFIRAHHTLANKQVLLKGLMFKYVPNFVWRALQKIKRYATN